MYVDYEFYSNVYGGSSVTQSDFNKYELKARLVMDSYTNKPEMTLKLLSKGKHTERIKFAMCELIDNTVKSEKLMENAQFGLEKQLSGAKSETTKDHTVSFSDKLSVTQVKEYINGLDMEVMYKYLIPTNLLYRGARVV